MTLTNEVTTLRRCTACGDLVDIDANFCPTCGTRQVDGIPRPAEPQVEEPAPAVAPAAPVDPAAAATTAGWLVVAGIVAALLVVFLCLFAARVLAGGGGSGHGAAGGGEGPAASAMDHYAPIAEGWQAKHDHVAAEGEGVDAAGLATAAFDAHQWIDVNSEALSATAANAEGRAAPLYRQLVDIYARRFTVLADIEGTAAAGGTGPGAAANELAELDALDQQEATAVCAIANIMRSEGDAPAEHITPAMNVRC